MKNLITGGTGSIGREIVFQLLAANEKVICFDRNEEKAFYLEKEIKEKFPDANFQIVLGDITNQRRVRDVIRMFKPDVVYHTAANKHVPLGEGNVKEFVRNNIQGTINVVTTCESFNSKIVLISTDKAVEPSSVMGYTKRMCELYILDLRPKKFTICRFGNIAGSSGSVLELFEQQAKTGVIKVTHPDMERYFILGKQAVSNLIQCSKLESGLYGFNMGKPAKINELALKFNLPIEYIGLRPGEKIKEKLLYDFETTLDVPAYDEYNDIYKINPGHIKPWTHIDIYELATNAENMTDEEIINKFKEINNEL